MNEINLEEVIKNSEKEIEEEIDKLEKAIDNFEREIVEFEGLKKIRTVTHEDYAKIERTRQLAEWLRDYKLMKEQQVTALRGLYQQTGGD